MLPTRHRLRRSDEFTDTVRKGVRVGRPTLVIHAATTSSPPTRVGFVVSKAVGGAVTRNRVRRRLRHLVAGQLQATPENLSIVVRALEPSAGEPGRLAGDLESAWQVMVRRVQDGPGRPEHAVAGHGAGAGR